MKKDSKRKTKILEGLDIEKQYTISEAVRVPLDICSDPWETNKTQKTTYIYIILASF